MSYVLILKRDIFRSVKYVFSLGRGGLGLASQLFPGPVLAAATLWPSVAATECVWHSEPATRQA